MCCLAISVKGWPILVFSRSVTNNMDWTYCTLSIKVM